MAAEGGQPVATLDVIRDFGATGDGSPGDATAIREAARTAGPNDLILFPPGFVFNGEGKVVRFRSSVEASRAVLKDFHAQLQGNVTWHGGSLVQEPGVATEPI